MQCSTRKIPTSGSIGVQTCYGTSRHIAAGFLLVVLQSTWGAPITVTVLPRSQVEARMGLPIQVYLDGEIDPDAPKRLTQALGSVNGKFSILLNSRGGNMFAGMELGRVIRKRGAWTKIAVRNTRTGGADLPGECYSACSLAFLGGRYRHIAEGSVYGVHRASLSTDTNVDLSSHLSEAVKSYMLGMGADPRLYDWWRKAGSRDMYLLSKREAKALRVVNWSC
jgi:hypothetical protein